MVMATPSPANDAALNEQLNVAREAAIENLREKSEEVRQQYRDEADKIEDQMRRSAEVVKSTIDAANANQALSAEANFHQAIENAKAVENAVYDHLAAPADGSQKAINYNRLNGVPLHLHADIIRTTQEVLRARDAYFASHPEERENPALQVHIGEDGLAKYGTEAEMQEQSAIASLDEGRAMPLDELRRVVQRQKTGRIQNSTKPLVEFRDNPDGSFDAVLQSGEVFKGFTANENREAIRQMAEGRVNTQRHYQQMLEQAVSAQPANGQQQVNQPQVEQVEQAQPESAVDPAWSAWLAEQALAGVAKQFGYANSAEFIADQNARYQRELQNNLLLEDFQNKQIVAQFFHENPDYPQSRQADDVIEEIINSSGWEWSPQSMAAAHALAVQRGIYRPLSPEDIALANGYAPQEQRRTPPPMLPSSNPDMARPTEDVNTMPLDQLRKLALTEGRAGAR